MPAVQADEPASPDLVAVLPHSYHGPEGGAPEPDAEAADEPAETPPAPDKLADHDKSVDPDKIADKVQAEADQIARREQRLKRLMSGFGVDDEATQDAIIEHLKSEVTARQQVREQVSQLYRLLRDKDTPDEQLRQLTAQLQTDFYLDRQRRLDAETQLDENIHYTQRPRCEAMLMLLGIVGDGPLMVTVPSPHSSPRSAAPRAEAPQPEAPAVEPAGPDPRIVEQERERREIIQRFDRDGDGRLDTREEMDAYRWLREHPPAKSGPPAQPPDAKRPH